MRIHITGNAGSGKSSFAESIGDILGVHVYGLDKIVWKEGWEKTPSHERKRLEEELVAKPQWIIEGVSSIVRQAVYVICAVQRETGATFLVLDLACQTIVLKLKSFLR